MLTNSQTPTLSPELSKFLPPPDAQTRASQFMKQLQDKITTEFTIGWREQIY